LLGYNVEYSSAGFALFFIGEYMHIIFMSVFAVIIFFGGWQPPNTFPERILIFMGTPSIVYIYDFIIHFDYYINNYPFVHYFWYLTLLASHWLNPDERSFLEFLKASYFYFLVPMELPNGFNPFVVIDRLLAFSLVFYYLNSFKGLFFQLMRTLLACLVVLWGSAITIMYLDMSNRFFFVKHIFLKILLSYNRITPDLIKGSYSFVQFFENSLSFVYGAPQKLYMLLNSYSFCNPFALIYADTIFLIKVNIMIWIFLLARAALPRFRYDQLMRLGWKVILPLSLFSTLLTATLIFIFEAFPPIR